MKKYVCVLMAFILVFVVASETFAKGGGGGGRASVSVSSPRVSTPSVSKPSTPKVSAPKSSIKTTPVKPKKVAAGTKVAFAPPASKVNGVELNDRDVYQKSDGSYTTYRQAKYYADCDEDDIREGDDDCKEEKLTDKEKKKLGLDKDKDKDKDKGLTGLAIFFIILLCVGVIAFLFLLLCIING